MKRLLAVLALAALALASGWLATRAFGPSKIAATGTKPPLRILAYTSFLDAWGPGPELASLYEDATGTRILFFDGGDAGMLPTKVASGSYDVAIGFDQASIRLARKLSAFRSEFVAYDWSPIAFVSRKQEVAPPTSLDDLTSPRFRAAIVFPDPRVSSVGLQFLLWIFEEKGWDEGFAFLEKLRPNVLATPSSWSAAYGLFQKKAAKLGLGYLTSPLYHSLEEKDFSYSAAVFPSGQPAQREFAAVPSSCRQCDQASRFLAWLVTIPAQRAIMTKNVMLPVEPAAAKGTPFASLAATKTIELQSADIWLARRDELFARWARTGL